MVWSVRHLSTAVSALFISFKHLCRDHPGGALNLTVLHNEMATHLVHRCLHYKGPLANLFIICSRACEPTGCLFRAVWHEVNVSAQGGVVIFLSNVWVTQNILLCCTLSLSLVCIVLAPPQWMILRCHEGNKYSMLQFQVLHHLQRSLHYPHSDFVGKKNALVV